MILHKLLNGSSMGTLHLLPHFLQLSLKPLTRHFNIPLLASRQEVIQHQTFEFISQRQLPYLPHVHRIKHVQVPLQHEVGSYELLGIKRVAKRRRHRHAHSTNHRGRRRRRHIFARHNV
ncbi:hypothetical protein QL285_026523 [Trifolium repens]|nr:hypothetical protein QL285_026523 [Trifolium repens]